MIDPTQVPRAMLSCDVADIDALHLLALRGPGWPERTIDAPASPLLAQVLQNHRCNSLLWNEEDQARRQDVPGSAIAANKRAIDRYNQARNDAIEAMDELILAALAIREPAPSAWINSETAGSLIDRLSISRLKVHHMAIQTAREDASESHRLRCAERLAVLRAQHAHLGACLHTLLEGLAQGRCGYRAHRQFKMYNDPTLNPCLYGPKDGGSPADGRNAR